MIRLQACTTEMALNAGYKVTSFSRELKSKNSAFLQKRGNALEKFQQIYQKNDLERRLSELPNTPAGRQVRAFIGEVEAFWDRWEKEKKQADRHYGNGKAKGLCRVVGGGKNGET